jgi:4-hydroxy-tetrahydrodipicolinate reductase
MGREVCRTVLDHPDLDLVVALDPFHKGADLSTLVGSDAGGLVVGDAIDSLTANGTEVVVDFTRLDAARETLAYCAGAGIHAVIGTTGFTEADVEELGCRFAGPASGAPNCIMAPNFAIGAVLMMRFAEMAAPWFDGAEIVEYHHEGKLDAPSGTSLRTAERMAAARAGSGAGEFAPDRTATVVATGARGATGPAGVRIHSVRLSGLVAHQEVVLGGNGQTLSIRHDSYDRASFMDGVVLAIVSVASRPGLTLGLEPLLGL